MAAMQPAGDMPHQLGSYGSTFGLHPPPRSRSPSPPHARGPLHGGQVQVREVPVNNPIIIERPVPVENPIMVDRPVVIHDVYPMHHQRPPSPDRHPMLVRDYEQSPLETNPEAMRLLHIEQQLHEAIHAQAIAHQVKIREMEDLVYSLGGADAKKSEPKQAAAAASPAAKKDSVVVNKVPHPTDVQIAAELKAAIQERDQIETELIRAKQQERTASREFINRPDPEKEALTAEVNQANEKVAELTADLQTAEKIADERTAEVTAARAAFEVDHAKLDEELTASAAQTTLLETKLAAAERTHQMQADEIEGHKESTDSNRKAVDDAKAEKEDMKKKVASASWFRAPEPSRI